MHREVCLNRLFLAAQQNSTENSAFATKRFFYKQRVFQLSLSVA